MNPRLKFFPGWLAVSYLIVFAFPFVFAGTLSSSGAERLRLIIETDAGGDPDDEQSLVRFLLYANEWDVEGIIANRPRARDGENRSSERTGLGIVRTMLNAYAECYPSLVQHDPRYPKPEVLRARTVAGYEDVRDGVNLILTAVDSKDRRPAWFSNWGTDHGAASSNLSERSIEVLRERGTELMRVQTTHPAQFRRPVRRPHGEDRARLSALGGHVRR